MNAVVEAAAAVARIFRFLSAHETIRPSRFGWASSAESGVVPSATTFARPRHGVIVGRAVRFPRIVIGYHGCRADLADDLLSGRRPVSEWPIAKGSWEWLGQGIYAWEHGPYRALKWADLRHGAKSAVVGMVIELDNDVLDLSDLAAITLLRETYDVIEKEYQARGKAVPRNTGKRRDLDCLVINRLCERLEEGKGQRISAVRGAFEEGERAFAGSMIRAETHVQIAVRDPRIIRGIFLPTDAPRPIASPERAG